MGTYAENLIKNKRGKKKLIFTRVHIYGKIHKQADQLEMFAEDMKSDEKEVVHQALLEAKKAIKKIETLLREVED